MVDVMNNKRHLKACLKVVKARMDEIGEIRDKLRADIETFQDLEANCQDAFEQLEDAAEIISRLC